jgi:hypothetical protein
MARGEACSGANQSRWAGWHTHASRAISEEGKQDDAGNASGAGGGSKKGATVRFRCRRTVGTAEEAELITPGRMNLGSLAMLLGAPLVDTSAACTPQGPPHHPPWLSKGGRRI